MTRLQGILAACGLTGLVLLAILLMGFKNLSQASAPTAASLGVPASQQQATSNMDPSTQALIQQYRAQLEQANQTIRQLQAERDQLAQMLGVQVPRGDEHGDEVEVGNE